MNSTLGKTYYLTLAILPLAACTVSDLPDFERLSPAELAQYNRSVEFWDQVYCVDDIRAGSHIRRRHCETLMELQENLLRQSSTVNVLSASRVY